MDLQQLRPRLSLSRVLDDLGATFLEPVSGQVDDSADVAGLVIWDRSDPPQTTAGDVVLGVGVDSHADTVELLSAVAGTGVSAVVLRAPVPQPEAVADLAGGAGTCVLALSRGASWAQLSEMLRSMLTTVGTGGDASSQDSLGGLPSGDLFAVANAISALLGAPVTIEDRSSRVLAFSGRQDEADPSRVETILGRQVPELYARLLSERGVFADLHRSDEPVFIEPLRTAGGGFTMPRVAVAVRAGDEVLGSVWAAVPERPDEGRLEALREATKLVALHMLRHRAGSDATRRIRADLLGTSLAGGDEARDALVRLGLADRPLVVLGLRLAAARPGDDGQAPGGGDDPSAAQDRQRLADAFSMHLAAVQPVSAAATIGHTTYGLLATSGALDDAEDRVQRLLADFVDRVRDRFDLIAATGPVAQDLQGVARSRLGVDRTLRAMASTGAAGVARLEDVQGEAMVLDLRDLAAQRGEQVRGPLARLVAYDEAHGAQLVETLREWFTAFGDVTLAARACFVHANTFRYRLRRVAEVGGIDLADPGQRFSLMLQLRVFEP